MGGRRIERDEPDSKRKCDGGRESNLTNSILILVLNIEHFP
jgi:hypothetical protein